MSISAYQVLDAPSFPGTGAENPVVFSGISDAAGWIPVGSFDFSTIQVQVGNQDNTFTVEGRVTRAATAFDVQAALLVASGTTVKFMDNVDIRDVEQIRLLENGAASDGHTAHLIAK